MTQEASLAETGWRSTALDLTRSAESFVSIGILFVMSALPLLETVGREFFARGIPGSANLVQHLTLILTFAGAALAARSGRLLTLSTQEMLPAGVRRWANVFTSGIAVAIVASLVDASVKIAIIDR